MLKIRELCVNLHGILYLRLFMKQFKTIYLLFSLLVMVSCTTTDSTEVTLYGDAAITSFTLGTMNRYVNSVKSTYTGGNYTFYIDHNKREIYNKDSLPTYTDTKHVVCTIASLNSGTILIERDEKGDTLDFYSSTDSIDFSRTRYLRVYPTNNIGYTRYAVKVNVHQQEPESFRWQKMSNIPVMSGLKSVCFGGKLYVFGNEGGQLKAYQTDDAGKTWNTLSLPATLTDPEAWRNLTRNADSVYIMNNSKVYHTGDMTNWNADNNELPEGIQLKQMLATGTEEIYALSNDNVIIARYTDFYWWYHDILDEDDEFPEKDFTSVVYPLSMADSTDVILAAGNKEVVVDGKTVWRTLLWRKVFDYSMTGAISEWKQTGILGGKWTYIDRAGEEEYLLTPMKSLQILRYDDALIAFGAEAYEELNHTACAVAYKSRDNGITWQKNASYKFPPTDATTGALFNDETQCISAVVDDEDYIWIFCANTGEVWRGCLNRLVWEKLNN